MQTKYKIIIVVVALATAFAAGRYTVPTSSKDELVAEKIQDQKKNTHTTTTTTTKPDGEKTTTTTTDVVLENTKSDIKSDTKEETSDKTHTSVSALTGASISSSPFSVGAPVYGIHVQRDLLGPVNVGAFVLSPNVVGVSVGLSF